MITQKHCEYIAWAIIRSLVRGARGLTQGRPLLFILNALLTAAFFCSPAGAHDLPINSIMNAFVKMGPREINLVVRIPLDLLRGIPFPVKDARYDVAASEPASAIALLLLADGFALWEGDVQLSASSARGRLSPPWDRSFEDYDLAAALTEQQPDPSTSIQYDEGFFDVHFTYPISSPKSEFKIRGHVAADLGSGAMLVIRYVSMDGSGRALVVRSGEEPAPLNPVWYHAAGGFVGLGVDHILTGIDHLLFLFCLVIPLRRLRTLLGVVTAFTLAHSVTLFASAFHLAPRGAWFPPLVEMTIAASIVYTAVENIAGANVRRRWLVACLFGLVHGFGFSNALGQSLQFAGSHLLLSLVSFNVGIEVGQLAVLAIMLPALAIVRRLVSERLSIVGMSWVVSLVGGYWMVERWNALYQTPWPSLDVEAVRSTSRWATLAVIVVIMVWILSAWASRKFRARMGLLNGDDRQPR